MIGVTAMKKLLTLMLALSMLLTLCACGTAKPADPRKPGGDILLAHRGGEPQRCR